MNGNSKFLNPIIAGAAAGVVVSLLMNTAGGRQILAAAKEAAGKAVRGWKNAVAIGREEAETAI